MKVRERDVRDPEPVRAQLAHAMDDAAAAIEEERHRARLQQISRVQRACDSRCRARAERGETHAARRRRRLDAGISRSASSTAAPRMRTLTKDETPGSCIVTPYTASAASVVVRGLWVMTMNCVCHLNCDQHAHEAADVRIVERRVDLVQQAEGARLREEDAEEQRQRDERALTAREQVDALRALAARATRGSRCRSRAARRDSPDADRIRRRRTAT